MLLTNTLIGVLVYIAIGLGLLIYIAKDEPMVLYGWWFVILFYPYLIVRNLLNR